MWSMAFGFGGGYVLHATLQVSESNVSYNFQSSPAKPAKCPEVPHTKDKVEDGIKQCQDSVKNKLISGMCQGCLDFLVKCLIYF